ncbi:hypothetical protein B5S31_g5415 [[Candida] boidinii]|nr:hypothetical protein B5S31_g5415 [[Candida] boidinii]
MSITAINHISPSNIQDTNSNQHSQQQQQNNIKSKFNGFKYKGKPPITDIPELIELCNHFIESKNYHGLALISRQRGLPPSLRGKIWPVLLKYHPHALNPYITPDDEEDDEEEEDDDDDQELDDQLQKEIKNLSKNKSNRKRSSLSNSSIPIKKIKFDLKRYLKYSKKSQSSDSDIINNNNNNDSTQLPSSASVSSSTSSSSSSSSSSDENASNKQHVPPSTSEEIPIVEYTSELEELFETQEKIFKVLEYSITKFLKKWGTLINYHSGLTWIALGLAEWIPPLPNSNYVLCGKDDIAKNGTKLRNLYDDYFERLNIDEFNKSSNTNSDLNSNSISNNNTNNSTASSSPPSTPKSTHSFDNSNGHPHNNNNNNNNYHDIISPFKPMSFSEIYERAVLIILHTPDPSNDEEEQTNQQVQSQQSQQSQSHQGQRRNSSVSSITGNSYSKYQSNGKFHTRRPSRNSVSGSLLRTSSNISSNSLTSSSSFSSPAGQANGFENDEISMTDEDDDNDNDDDDEIKNEFLPIMGGTIEENVSSFLYCLRKSLPELFQVLAEEDVLNVNSNKGDWIIYWLKYFGAKVFSRYDRGRLWDMLFGWRLRSSITNEEYNNLSLEIDNDILNLLGQDIFWNPMLFNDNNNNNNNMSDFKKIDRRNSSIKTIVESSSDSYSKPEIDISTLSTTFELNNDKNLPFSIIDSHFELIFLSLAFLKSKEFSLLELEQSEIKEFLNKMSSQKIDNFKNFLNNKNQNNNQNNQNNQEINSNNKNKHNNSSNSTPHSLKNNNKMNLKSTLSNNSSNSNLNEHDIDPFTSVINSPSQEPQSLFSGTNNNINNNNNSTQFQKSLLNRFNEMNIQQQQQQQQRTGTSTGNGHAHTNTNTNTTISSSISYYKSTRNQNKSLSRDIENIIVEAGELWRKFYYNESIEENQ